MAIGSCLTLGVELSCGMSAGEEGGATLSSILVGGVAQRAVRTPGGERAGGWQPSMSLALLDLLGAGEHLMVEAPGKAHLKL